ATYTTVAQVIDIVDLTPTITQLDQHLDGLDDVVVGERQGAVVIFTTTQPAVDLHAANARQIVGFLAVEQTLEQGLDRIFGGGLTRTHHAIDRNARSVLV